MTTVAAITAADLELMLSGSAPDNPPCSGSVLREDPCTLEAVARVEWDAACGHWPPDTLHCSGHLGELRAELESGRLMVCPECRKLVRVAGIGPVR